MDDRTGNQLVVGDAPMSPLTMEDTGSSNVIKTGETRPQRNRRTVKNVARGGVGVILVIVVALIVYYVIKRNVEGAGTGNPVLEVIPMPDSYHTDNTLIDYRRSDKASVSKWSTIIDTFFHDYRKENVREHKNLVVCSSRRSTGSTDEEENGGEHVCDVPLDDFHPCVLVNRYNYHKGAPCVFLKLSKILNWVPQPYNSTYELPPNMPVDLQQHIKMLSDKPEANEVWVSCEGENPPDVENVGPIQYIPRQGFPAYYFPFTNQRGYLSPVVAVLFQRPMTGILINIECKAWAKNIQNDRYEQGSVHFELLVDS